MKDVIVIAEDHKELNDIIRIRLEKSGFEVVSCLNGAVAYEKIIDIHPNLVILDLDLPDIYGFELLGRIRNVPGFEDIKVLILTGVAKQMNSDTTDEQWQQITGVHAFLSKPFNSEDLMDKIQELLKK
ncbi:MAG: response regulator [Candidatus Aureabacteria bacterium]|nr:response regulator [Candidatus Auribacterota bacterium]